MAGEPDRVTLTPEQLRRRRARSIAIALALGVALIAIGFSKTIFSTTAPGVKSSANNAVSVTSSSTPEPLPKR